MGRRTGWAVGVLLLLLSVAWAAIDLSRPVRFDLQKELRLGREAAPKIEKEFGGVLKSYERKFGGQQVDLVALVQEIGAKIVAAAEKLGPQQVPSPPPKEKEPQKMSFTFKVLNSQDVNAFSLWGGYVYVTKGLLDFLQSPDELAGVLGHEVGHSMFHHLLQMEKVGKTIGNVQLAVLIGILLGGSDKIDVGDVYYVSEWLKIAVLNAHSIEHEQEADYVGVLYAHAAGYNPVGLLTFMKRLAREAQSRPQLHLGAAQTHPWSYERATAIARQIRGMGLPINDREVIAALKARAQAAKVGGQNGAEVLLGEEVVFRLVDKGRQKTPLARAQAIATALNAQLDARLQPDYLRLVKNDAGKLTLIAIARMRGLLKYEVQPLLEVLPADAKAQNTTPENLAKKVHANLVRLLRLDFVVNYTY